MPDSDYLIVGSGAGGAAAAYALVQAGARVRLLEKGGELPDDGSTLDPVMVVRGRFNAKEIWKLNDGRRFMPEEHFNVGGKTRWYGAALLRMQPHEFEGEPALGLKPWPIGLNELSGYYRQAEQLLGVQHFADEPALTRISAHLQRAGWQASSMPLGLVADIERHPYEQTHYDGYAVPYGLKADARYRLLERLRGHEHFELLTQAEVSELTLAPGDSTRVSGVRCRDGRSFTAGTVLLAAGSMHSPRLLQRCFEGMAAHARPPSARWVGRYYKRHILTAMMGFGARWLDDRTGKTSLFVHERFPHGSVQPLGGWAGPEEVRIKLPAWLPDCLKYACVRRAYGFFLQTEDGSHADNRVLAGEPPTLDYELARMPELAREHAAMVSAFGRALLRAGLVPLSQRIGPSGTAHCVGTLIAGADPMQSVVDARGRVHGLGNLYVVDGSVLPRLGRMNPSLTIYAWALRVAQLLCESRNAAPT